MAALLIRASGIVLTGGESRRMGRDKALLPVGTPPTALAVRVAGALRAGACPDITCVGGDLAALRALGLDAVPDDHPGEGPLGGVLTGLRTAALGIVLVLACDLPAIDGATVRGLVTALSMMSPWGPPEKQALLESPDHAARARTLIAITEMELAGANAPEAPLQ